MRNLLLPVALTLLCAAMRFAACHANEATPAPVAKAGPAPALTAQQQFDNASAAVAQNHCAEAVQLFEGLAARPGIARNAKVMAAINARRALCLVTLGRFDEATADATSAIAALNANDPVDRGQLVMAHTALGEVAYFAIDYGNATREFTLALGLTSGADRYEPLTWLARSTMFDADARSVDYAAEALKIAEASPDTRKAVLASDHTLHARALLNHGSYAAAYDELQKALKAQGGLTERVTVDEVVTRADLALAAILNKDEDSAREYLAYAGAGHFDHGVFSAGVAMGPPPCGGPADLRPDDAVVVQFGINDSGEVSYAYPIYASRNGPAAAEFARAVAGWSWTPDSVKKIPAFFRLVTRLELHCSMATAHPDVLDILRNDLRGWLDGRHVPPYAEAADKLAAVDAARAELLKRQGENDPLERVPVLLALGNSHFVTPAERLQWNQQARDILAAAGAPLGALTYLDVRLSNGLAHAKYSYRDHRAYLRSLLANPAVAADPQVDNVLRLLIAEEHYGLPPAPDAADLLTAAATDPGLAAQDPLRVGALLRLATLQAAAGNVAAARDSYAKSGLSAQQCSLVDAMPVMRRSGAEMVDFPDEASRWGFDGWVEVEFDIQADGKTANQRTLIAYPPMVFVETALETVRHERYTQTYRPEGGVGCGGKLIRINFESSGP